MIRRTVPLLLLGLLLVGSASVRVPARAQDGGAGYGSYSRLPEPVAPLREDMAGAVRRERRFGPGQSHMRNPANPKEYLGRIRPALEPGALQQKVVQPVPPPGAAAPQAPAFSPGSDREFDTIPDTGYFPADSAIAAGPGAMVSLANSHVKVQGADGSFVSFVSLTSFFPSDPTGFLFDPRCSFDPVSGRFVLVAIGRNDGLLLSTCAVAVSATDNPAGVWNKYVFDVGRGGGQSAEWADFPNIGFDDEAIYVTFNMFSFGTGSFGGNRVLVLDKGEALAGVALTPVVIDDITLPPPFAPGSLASTLKPTETADASRTDLPGLLIGRAGSQGLALFRLADPLARSGEPRVTGSFVDTTDYALPGPAPQRGSAVPLNTGDQRLQKTVMRDGVIWTCHTVSGTGLDGGRSQVRFYRVQVLGPGILLDADTISDPSLHYYFPSVVPDRFGNAVAVFIGSDAARYASMYHARYDRLTGAFDIPVLTEAGISSYRRQDDFGRNRWGDYTDASLDPQSGGVKIWIQGQLPVNPGLWKLRAARVPTSGLTVISPNGGEQVPAGSAVAIRWRSVDVPGTVRLELSRDGGATFSTLLAGTPNDGVETVPLPGPAGTRARVRVSSVGVPQIQDTSDGDFTLAASFSVSGRVTLNGSGLAGVRLEAGGMTTLTTVNGSYSVGGLSAGSYSVTAEKDGYELLPTSRVTSLGPSRTGVDFTARILRPERPTGLSAVTASASQIDLSWVDRSPNEAGFTLQQRKGSGRWKTLATLPADRTTHEARELRANTSYSYRVRAFNAAGRSRYSNTARARTSAN